jgi:rhamnose utilization protein RhaD (predicted bifunctional aldolase and dehydrogenase)
VKLDGVLWIKPSGVPMASLAAGDLVPLDQRVLLEVLDRPSNESNGDVDPVTAAGSAARLAEAHGRRPSVELLFHALLPERYVLHTHPVVANSVTCNQQGMALTERLFGDGAVWVPYTDPGLPLARAIRSARSSKEARTGRAAPAITFLGNHGLVVGADRVEDIEAQTFHLTELIEAELGRCPETEIPVMPSTDPAIVNAIRAGLARPAVAFDGGPLAAWYTATHAGRSSVAGGPLTPDQIVYAGSWALVIDIDGVPVESVVGLVARQVAACAARDAARDAASPTVAVVPGVGVFATGERMSQAETVLDVYLDALRISAAADRLGGVRHLSGPERTFIEHWEAEAYRRAVAIAG